MSESTKNLSENLLNNNQEHKNEEEKEKNVERFQEEARVELSPSFSEVQTQIWKGNLANGLAFMTGINTGFSTVFITKLISDQNIRQFTKSDASWLASLAVLSGPVGAFCIGPIMDKLGRKRAITFANIFPIICWGLTYIVNESLWPLYIARIIGGFGGAMMSPVSVYISEICHPKVRDVMLVLVGAFVSTGTLFTMILGSYMEWHQASLCFSLVGGISLITTFFLPESPLWLVTFRPSQERLNEALRLSRYFNRSQMLYEKDSTKIKEIYANTKKSDSIPKKRNPLRKWLVKNIKLFKERGVYKPMIILCMVFFFWASSGVFVVLLYSANVFKAIGGDHGGNFDEYTATILVGLVKLIMTLVSAFLSFRIGRRVLMITSSLGMAVTIITAAICQSFSNTQIDFSKNNLTTTNTTAVNEVGNDITNMITVISLVLYILMGSLAMTNLPWALISELLPTRARAIGNSVITSYGSLILFAVIKSTPLILDIISLSTLFLAFGSVSTISAIYIYFKVPETFGRNFQEIEKYFIK